MNFTLQGVHYSISDRTKAFLDEKLTHIDPFKELIVDMDVTITKEKTEFRLESNVHFKWGARHHFKESNMELYPAIENWIDKMEAKIAKEKDKIKDHKDHKDHHKELVLDEDE